MARPKSNKPKLSWRMRQFIKDPDSFSTKRITNMCAFDKLDDDFIRKYWMYLDWDVVSADQYLSHAILQEFADKVNWYYYFAYKYEDITDEFIREFVDYINWEDVSKTDYNFSKDILREFRNKIDWEIFSRWQPASVELMEEMKDVMPFTGCLQRCKFSEEFIEKYITKFTADNYYNNWGWILICRTQKLSDQFMDRWKNNLNWLEICECQDLSTQFMREHAKYLDWKSVGIYQKLNDEQFIIDYWDKLNKNDVVLFQDLNQDFMRKYFADTIDWVGNILYSWNRDYLTYKRKNNGLTKEFLIEMLERQYSRKGIYPYARIKIKELIEEFKKDNWYAQI